MFRSVVLICLFVSAFADTLTINTVGCTYHVKVSTARGVKGDYYGVTLAGTSAKQLRLAKIVHDDDSYELYRCDDRSQQGNCYIKTVTADSCKDSYGNSRNFALPSMNVYNLQYNASEYPIPEECPDSSFTGCLKYCSTGGFFSQCVIVDSNGFLAQNYNGDNFTHYPAPSMDVFEDDKCEEPHTHLAAPSNLCETTKTITPVIPSCSYHVKTETTRQNVEYYGVVLKQNSQDVPMYLKSIRNGATTVLRCDDKNQNRCYSKTLGQTRCTESYTQTTNHVPQWPTSSTNYDSSNYPKPADCPDNSTGCKKYCEDASEYMCVIFDADGHLVSDGTTNWTFFEPPSADEFDVIKCDNTTLPALDYCNVLETVSPKTIGCKFRISVEGKQETNDYYGLVVDGKALALRVQSGEGYQLYRCDLEDHPNQCYTKTNQSYTCQNRYASSTMSNINRIISSILPQAITYNNTAYPLDAQCPDGTDGCKKYCSMFTENECVLVNSDGYFVQTTDGRNLTYTDEISMDVFETDTCESPATHIPAPSDDVCPVVQSSSTPTSHSSSKGPTPTPSSTSRASSAVTPGSSVNSASTVKSIFTFVALVIVLALC